MSTKYNKLLMAFLFFSVVFFAIALLAQNSAEIDPDVDMRRLDASGNAPATEGAEVGSVVNAEAGAGLDSDLSDEADVTIEMASTSVAARGDQVTLGSYGLEEPSRHFKLKNRLREISGLAMLGDNRLLAHDDEKGVVVELDYRDGSIVKSFKLGGPRGLVADDLEGIAVAEDRIFLVSSSGRLYEFEEGADGETVPYFRHDTGVGKHHEIEGLAYNPDQRTLLLISKNPVNPRQGDPIAIYSWSLDTRRLVEDGRILIESSAFTRRIDRKRFQPSGIERHPETGNYFVLAARQRAIAEISPQGTVLSVSKLKTGRHRQAEGIAFASDNTMVIADEGAGKRATLSFYPVEKGR